MKKKGLILGVVLLLLLSSAVLAAAYSASITVTESDGTDHDQAPLQFTVNNTYLATNAFMNSSGNDTRVLAVDNTEMPHMVADTRTLFTSSVTASTQHLFSYTLGDTPLSTFYTIIGEDGGISVADNTSIELGDNSTVELKGWFNTESSSGSFAYKPSTYRIYNPESGNITVDIYSGSGSSSETLRPSGVGYETSIESVAGAATHWEAAGDANDASYVYQDDADTWQRDSYLLADSTESLHFHNITSVTVYFRISAGGGRTCSAKPHFRIGSTNYEGSVQTTTSSSWVQKNQNFSTSPATGEPWTWAEVDAMELGISIKSSGLSYEARCSDIWILVYYPTDTEAFSVSTAGVTSEEYTVLIPIGNPVNNSSFEDGNPPDDWTIVAGTVNRTTDQVKYDTYSMSIAAPGTTGWVYQRLPSDFVDRVKGETVAYGCWLWASQASSVKLWVWDGIGGMPGESAYHTGDSTWRWYETQIPVDVAAPYIEVRCYALNTTGYFDGAIAINGVGTDLDDWGNAFELYIDGYQKDLVMLSPTDAVPDTSYDWQFMTGDVAPYMEYIKISVDGTQELWFQPTSMIIGTNLPDRATSVSNNGTITWGSNPSGIDVLLGALLPETQSTATAGAEAGVPEFMPETDPSEFVTGGVEGENFPFYDLFKDLFSQWNALGGPNISMPYFWKIVAVILGWTFGTAVMLSTRNVFFGLIAYFIGFAIPAGAMGGVLDLWVPVVYALGALSISLLTAKWGVSSL